MQIVEVIKELKQILTGNNKNEEFEKFISKAIKGTNNNLTEERLREYKEHISRLRIRELVNQVGDVDDLSSSETKLTEIFLEDSKRIDQKVAKTAIDDLKEIFPNINN